MNAEDKWASDKGEAEARKKRMADLETRIGMTDSGLRFIQRINEIGRCKPLRSEPEDEGE